MDSSGDEQNAILLYCQLSQSLENAGMQARKWLRNSTHILKEVHQEDHLSKVDFNHEDLPSKKTLGVVWTAEADVFTFKTKPPKSNLPLTKRNVLRNVATLFDPLGLITLYCHVNLTATSRSKCKKKKRNCHFQNQGCSIGDNEYTMIRTICGCCVLCFI